MTQAIVNQLYERLSDQGALSPDDLSRIWPSDSGDVEALDSESDLARWLGRVAGCKVVDLRELQIGDFLVDLGRFETKLIFVHHLEDRLVIDAADSIEHSSFHQGRCERCGEIFLLSVTSHFHDLAMTITPLLKW